MSLRVERDDAYASALLHSPRMARLDRRERGFVTELVMGSLRRRGELDYLLSARLRKPTASLDPEVLTALRLGAYQLRYMSGVAPYAAVWQSVELTKLARKRSAAPLVNAVLRNLPPAPPSSLGIRLSHPDWLLRRWEASYPSSTAAALLRANLRPPATYFHIPRPAREGDVLTRLRRAGIGVESSDLPRAYLLDSGDTRTARSSAGIRLRFQDINSQRVAALLGARRGSRVLDVCSAPGGKARILAESARVVACDRHLGRLRAMQRRGCHGIDILAVDAERRLPFCRRFRSVLVDAPCSGTGTLARNPEIKWRLRPEDLAHLSGRQTRILENALDVLAPGGTLVYATCSIEPEENDHVVEVALRNWPRCKARKIIDTVPGRDPGDGFQAWRIRKPLE